MLATGVITAAKLTALATDIAAALALAGDATTARATLEAAVKSIIARRREIQFAADAKWPPSDPANAGIFGAGCATNALDVNRAVQSATAAALRAIQVVNKVARAEA